MEDFVSGNVPATGTPLSPEVAAEFERYCDSLKNPPDAYRRELKIAELLRLTDRPAEQLQILRHTIASGWQRLVPPEEVAKSIFDRQLAEEIADRKVKDAAKHSELIADWHKGVKEQIADKKKGAKT